MKREELLSRISIDPNICFGKPCVKGHRIWVSLILDLLASGMTITEILEEYPGLEEADIYACIVYCERSSLGECGTLMRGLARESIERKLWIVEPGRIREYLPEEND
jgi:uncharacterized protein (DUF433 family)